jgi:hypothetical protein
MVGAVFFSLYMLIAAFSMGFAKKMQMKASIGGEVISFFLDNHLLYVWTCILVWSATLYNCFYLMWINSQVNKNPEEQYVSQAELEMMISNFEFAQKSFEISLLITLLQGFAMAIVRTNEPIYSFLLTREWKSWFGELYDEDTESNDLRKNLAVQLMNAQLSIELVYTILYTITEHTSGMQKSKDYKIYKPYDFEGKHQFLIESMTVNNPKNLTVNSNVVSKKQ